MKKLWLIGILWCIVVIQLPAQQTIWTIVPDHSSIQFSVTHLVVSTVTGKFNIFKGTIKTTGADFSNARISAQIDVNSIDTENMTRDKHLREDDFFNVKTYPYISFTSTDFKKTSDNQYTIVGDLTIRDVTMPIELEAVYGGEVLVEDKIVSGFKAKGSLNRFEYGLKWDDVLDSGSLVVSEEVDIVLNLQLVKN